MSSVVDFFIFNLFNLGNFVVSSRHSASLAHQNIF